MAPRLSTFDGGSRQEWLKNRIGLSGLCLPIPVQPRRDETFFDLITRSVVQNGYVSRTPVLKMLIDDVTYMNWSFAALDKRSIDLQRASDLLGNYGGKLQLGKLYTQTDFMPNDRKFNFFGAKLTRWHISSARRVSPRALRKDLYLRALWRLRDLQFDPDTKEMLLDKCPVCEKPLSDSTTAGLQYCERCAEITERGSVKGVDLRDFPQPMVPDNLWSTLDFVSGLVDPRIEKQEKAIARVPPEIHGCRRDTLFELISYLARNLTPGLGPRSIPPEHLASAGNAIISWPDGFAEYVATHMQLTRNSSSTSRRGFHIFGAKSFLDVPQTIIDIMKYELKRGSSKQTTSPASLKPAQYRAKVTPLNEQRARLACIAVVPGFQQLVKDTGLPPWSLAECLADPSEANHDRLEERASILCEDISLYIRTLRAQPATPLASLRSLRIKPAKPAAVLVRLDRAVSAIWHKPGNPWSVVMKALCNGTLPSARGNPAPETVVQSFVKMDELHKILLDAKPCPWIFTALPIPIREVEVPFGFSRSEVSFLRRNGCLPSETFIADILTMKKDYILTIEIIQRRLSSAGGLYWIKIAETLDGLGITPVVKAGTLRVWSRNEVEEKLKGRIVGVVE